MPEQPSGLLIETWNLGIGQVFLRLIITLILEKIKEDVKLPTGAFFKMHH